MRRRPAVTPLLCRVGFLLSRARRWTRCTRQLQTQRRSSSRTPRVPPSPPTPRSGAWSTSSGRWKSRCARARGARKHRSSTPGRSFAPVQRAISGVVQAAPVLCACRWGGPAPTRESQSLGDLTCSPPRSPRQLQLRLRPILESPHLDRQRPHLPWTAPPSWCVSHLCCARTSPPPLRSFAHLGQAQPSSPCSGTHRHAAGL